MMTSMTTSDEDVLGAQPPPPPPPDRSTGLHRSTHRYVGGVAGGIAELIRTDPLVVRLGLVVVALWLPWTILLYILAWLVLPDAVTGRSLLGSIGEPDGWRAVGGVLLLGLGALMVAPAFGLDGDGALTIGVVALGIGILLVRHHPAITAWGAGSPPPAPSAPPSGPSSPPARQGWASHQGPPPSGGWPPPGGRPLAGDVWPPPSAPPPTAPFTLARLGRPRRPSSPLSRLGLSILVVLIGLLAALDRGIEPVKPGIAASLCLLLLGIILLISAWRGRARLLLPLGVALLPFWLGWALADVPRYPHDGDADYTLEASDSLPAAYEHGYGNMDVDLRQLRIDPGETGTVRIGLTAGRARLFVPEDIHVVVQGDIGLGYAEIVEDPYGVRPADTGTAVLRTVTIRAGDPEVCTAWQTRDVAEPQPGIDEPVPRGSAERESEAPPTAYRTPFGEGCQPTSIPDDPPVLELNLDLGIGTLEVHRVHPRP
jgi:phage shock protein PspC (stress-responsive transcriptional regulator)